MIGFFPAAFRTFSLSFEKNPTTIEKRMKMPNISSEKSSADLQIENFHQKKSIIHLTWIIIRDLPANCLQFIGKIHQNSGRFQLSFPSAKIFPSPLFIAYSSLRVKFSKYLLIIMRSSSIRVSIIKECDGKKVCKGLKGCGKVENAEREVT